MLRLEQWTEHSFNIILEDPERFNSALRDYLDALPK